MEEELNDGLLIYSNNANFVADSFLLDDLWDFSNEGIGGSIGNNGGSHNQSLFPDQHPSSSLNTVVDSARCTYIAQPSSDILPFSIAEDAETGLEWLSALESSSSGSGSGSDGAGNSGESHKNPESKHSSSFSMVIPCRARSKRNRFQVHPSKSGTQDSSSLVTHTSQSQAVCAEKEQEEKKLKKVKRKGAKGNGNGSSGQARRCTHCQTQKTPQWRQGPLGPKSLCNACGVRFKTGRLYPEYRPAKSPSFVSCLHSNSHKKVLEMRTLGIPDIGIELHHASVQIMSHRSYDFC